MKIAIYPGSFDPITNGHLDIIKRSAALFDKVIVLIAINPNKKSHFDLNERLEMINDALKESNIKNVVVDSYEGLTVNYAKKHQATVLIRGLRVVSDFEYEWSLNAANEYIDNSIERVFLMSSNETNFISSSAINEMYQNGVDISRLVPKTVLNHYLNK